MADINLKKYAGQGQAVALFGTFLPDNIGNYPNVHVLSADMSAAASLSRYIYQNPDKYTEIGIAEQNLVGISAGMASEGFTPIAIAQAAFITMRAFEMNRQYLGYMKNKVILVGLNSGLYLQYFGNTHYCVEDISILRSIPDMTILSPADAGEAVMALDAALRYDGASYIRLTGGSQLRTVYNEYCDFAIGKDIVVREGSNICIFATGACVGNSIEAANILSVKYGIEARVVDVHTLKPFDTETVDHAKEHPLIVTAEEHSIIGGLGSTLSDYTASKGGFPPIMRLGINDIFSKPGDYNYLMKQHRLTPELIAEDIYKRIKTL